MKARFPFKLGCTSYIFPADIIPNVRQMADQVDDIELLFYEWSEKAPALTSESCQVLNELANTHSISYTVHLPIYFSLNNLNNPMQMTGRKYLANICDIIERTAPLNPYAYILHLEGVHFSSTDSEIHQWQDTSRWLCTELISSTTVRNNLSWVSSNGTDYQDIYKKICIENLDYPMGWFSELVTDCGFSLCIDIGHLWKYQPDDWLLLLQKALPQTRVIHLHGEKEQKDHISLKKCAPCRLKTLWETIKQNYNHIVTLEVFNEKDISESLEMVNELWQN